MVRSILLPLKFAANLAHLRQDADNKMSMDTRLEKLRFLIAEMQIAFQLATFAPSDFEARVLVRHVIVRAESFIAHTRSLRKPLQQSGTKTKDFHQTKENYARLFDEYFHLVRDRLGAHVQDIDFTRRIDLWNDIEFSKSQFFVDGAIEIYNLLGTLNIPFYIPYEQPPLLSDPTFSHALQVFRASGSAKLGVEMGSDPLAMTRPNTSAMLNLSPIHVRAGQIALTHRWITMSINQLSRFSAFPDVVRIIKGRLITDVISACDCILTRNLASTASQRMDGLDALIDAGNFSPNPVKAFAAVFAVEANVAPFRSVRDQIGAHLELDPLVTLHSLLGALDDYKVTELLDFYSRIRNVFEKTCRSVIFLVSYLIDGQTLTISATTSTNTVPFSPDFNVGRTVATSQQFVDTDQAYAGELQNWMSIEKSARASARSYFYEATMRSEVVECFTKIESFGEGCARYHRHDFRVVHVFLLRQLEVENDSKRVIGILALIAELRSGDPDVLTELLLRFVQFPTSMPHLAAIAYCLGVTATWWNDEVKALLLVWASRPMLAINSRVALFKMFITTEGLNRINHPTRDMIPFSEIDLLTDGLSTKAKAVIQVVLASQLCDQRVATFLRPFEQDFAAIQADIVASVALLAPSTEASRISNLARQLAASYDFAGVSLLLFNEFKGTPNEDVGFELARLTCQGVILTAFHDQAQKHLCGCHFVLEQKQAALEIGNRLAVSNPDNIDHQILLLEVLSSMPEHAAVAVMFTKTLKERYRLTADQLSSMDEIAKRKKIE